MKTSNKIIDFDYQVTLDKVLEVDLNELADFLIDSLEDDLKVDEILDYFGDNVEYCLHHLGLPDDVELYDYDEDHFYDQVYDDLFDIIEERLK